MYDDTEKLGDRARHDAAILWLAMDSVIGDELDLDYAVAHTKRWVYYMDNDPQSPWADGQHSGDCTQTAHTCARCMYENALAWVDKMWDNERAADYVLKEGHDKREAP